MNIVKNILLCGFSGSGKTTLLTKFKKKAGSDFFLLDLDEEIEKREGRSIRRMVTEQGFDFFRRLECEFLKEILDSDTRKLVLALGGGTLEYNYDFLRENRNTLLVWLDVPFSVCYERISQDSKRPLLDAGKSALEKIYDQRLKTYQKADVRLGLKEIEEVESPEDLLHLGV